MPEKTTVTYREKSYTLSDADRNGQIVEAHCRYCKLTYNFRPADLIAVLGNQKVYSVAAYFTCQKCKKKDYMSAKLRSYDGSHIGKLPIRELVKVYYVKKSQWKDGVL
jgi:hypothetical protein